MTNGGYIVDTHALLWFLTNDKRLSRRAEVALQRAAEGTTRALISTISLAEANRLIEKGAIRLRGDLLDQVAELAGLAVVPFDLDTFREMTRLPAALEIHDRIIAATTKLQSLPLITRDPAFRGLVRVIW